MGVFLDKAKQPDDELLKKVLGTSYKIWEEIKHGIIEEYSPVNEEWKFYGAKSGWTLKLLLKKRNLFFFAPYEKHFIIAFVFGDKAVAVVEKSELPASLIKELVSAKKYAEGRGLSLEIKKKTDVNNVLKLVKIKIEN
jgi:hypothetical protein